MINYYDSATHFFTDIYMLVLNLFHYLYYSPYFIIQFYIIIEVINF
jgi:hypothetical protein